MGKKDPLSANTIKSIVELTIKTFQEQQELSRKKAYDKKLHKTKLLLEHYRELTMQSNNAIYEASQCDEDVYDVLSLLTQGSGEKVYIESIKRNAVRTRLMLEHVRKALDDYESFCKRTKKEEEMRRYRTVMRLYIEEEPWEYSEIAEEEMVDISTVYKDVKAAIKRLSPRIFGVDVLF